VAIACVGVATAIVLGGGDVLEIIIDFFGALAEGGVAIFEAIEVYSKIYSTKIAALNEL
jgi:hypothetical protein